MSTPTRTYIPAFTDTALELTEFLPPNTRTETIVIEGNKVPRFFAEIWTSKQRQASSLHEISYRACFKPQLPRFFIERLTGEGDVVYDPFMGRGTTIIETALVGRTAVGNDVNPLSKILTEPRLFPPLLSDVEERLQAITFDEKVKAEINLSMFYHHTTESEIVSLQRYLSEKKRGSREDNIDKWIRMVATNRLTGHSSGFFSVYTLPPNQAATPKDQERINSRRKQTPSYRDVKAIILKKTRSLLRTISEEQRATIGHVGLKTTLHSRDASERSTIDDGSVQLTVTSPPFLDVVNYSQDNWLRCWFNSIDHTSIAKRISVVRSLEQWKKIMQGVFHDLYRITRRNGFVAFEVGEIRKRNVLLDEVVVPLGLNAGFRCIGILINEQEFTKTSNIWGIRNNSGGTNTNRIVLFQKLQ